MKHVLFIAFHYPPEASSSGVLRPLKFTRYLRQYGWRSTVITPQREAFEARDDKLEREIPESVNVVRTPFLNTKRHFAIWGRYPALLAVPDRWIGWFPWAVRAAWRVFKNDPFDVIFSTSPHPTTHLIAWRLANKCRCPWVADFRDPWYEEPPEPGTPAVVHWAARHLERRVVGAASRAVASTPELADSMAARYPHESAEKFISIVNGYDEADFADLPPSEQQDVNRMTMLHAGGINGDYRDPRPLFRALADAIWRGKIDRHRVRVRLIGPGPFGESEAVRQSLVETGLTDVVELTPRVPYDQALRELSAADLPLLLQASEDTVALVPSKLYEYLRAQRPVLAIVYNGACSRLLAATGGGWAVDPRDEATLSTTLSEIYHLWQIGDLSHQAADIHTLQSYSRERLTGELARVFEAIV